jgi:hypothetical protein
MPLAPIALFAYNRPSHTRATVESLLRNPQARESRLHVFCDGPKSPDAQSGVAEVREYVRRIEGFRSVVVTCRESNLGLARSIIAGVTAICDEAGRAIVLEDDLVVAPGFLRYMNAALDRYESSAPVMQVSGFMFPVDMGTRDDAMFLPITTSWGWATWARAWRHFDAGMSGLDRLKADGRLRWEFNLRGAYDYYGMLLKQSRGQVDSWAIRWYLSVFLRQGLVLYPARTLVYNAGFDGSGTHCGSGDFGQAPPDDSLEVEAFPAREILYPHWRRVMRGFPGAANPLLRHLNRGRAAAHNLWRSVWS